MRGAGSRASARRRRSGEELREGLVHAARDAAVLGLEARGARRRAARCCRDVGRAAPRAAGSSGSVWVWNSSRIWRRCSTVRRKTERLAEEAPERLRQVAALGQAEDGAQAVPLAEPRVVARVEELERLHQELDLADAAHAQLDVAALDALGAQRRVDLRLHAADRGDDVRIHAGAEDEGADEVEEARGHARVARAEARLDQRLPLPQLRPLREVRAVAVEREDRRRPSVPRDGGEDPRGRRSPRP